VVQNLMATCSRIWQARSALLLCPRHTAATEMLPSLEPAGPQCHPPDCGTSSFPVDRSTAPQVRWPPQSHAHARDDGRAAGAAPAVKSHHGGLNLLDTIPAA
jgi:hypothetical protein